MLLIDMLIGQTTLLTGLGFCGRIQRPTLLRQDSFPLPLLLRHVMASAYDATFAGHDAQFQHDDTRLK